MVENKSESYNEKIYIISKNKAFIYAAFGAFIATILDTAVNFPSNCQKFGVALAKILTIEDFNGFNVPVVLGVFFVVIVAAVIARTEEFRTEKAAMMSGLMIFSTIALMTPVKPNVAATTPIDKAVIKDSPKTKSKKVNFFISKEPGYYNSSALFSEKRYLIKVESEQRNIKIHEKLEPNGTILDESTVSSCKPSYYGFLGLSSLIYNKLHICRTGHILKYGERVKILDTWETWARGYWYAKINYLLDEKIHTGWVQAGWKEYPWGFLQPDKTDNTI